MPKKRTISDLIRDEVQQQSLFNIEAYSNSYSPDWATDVGSCVPQKEATHEQTHEQTHEPKFTQWVQTYWVSRRGVKHEYFRFCYLTNPGDIGSCVRVHIPGGNTKSPGAIAIKALVENAIANCNSPQEIIALIAGQKQRA